MSRQRSTWEDEERWSPEDQREAVFDATHVWPGAILDTSNPEVRDGLLAWLDSLDN